MTITASDTIRKMATSSVVNVAVNGFTAVAKIASR